MGPGEGLREEKAGGRAVPGGDPKHAPALSLPPLLPPLPPPPSFPLLLPFPPLHDAASTSQG
jgi:hypothetical protein